MVRPITSLRSRRLRFSIIVAGVTVVVACAIGAACGGGGASPGGASNVDAATAESGSLSGNDAPTPVASYAKLINDDSVWVTVPTPGSAAGPVLHEARVSPDPFPRRTWTSCGSGCRESAAGLPFDVRVGVGPDVVAAGDFTENEGYLLLGMTAKEVPARLTRIERLSDGATIRAVVARGQTQYGQLAYGGGAAPFVLAVIGPEGRIRMARTFPDARPTEWQPGWRSDVGLALERFALGDGIGLTGYGGSLLFPTAAAADPLDIQPGTALAHARGTQLFYGYAQSTIHSFTYAGGSAPIVTLPNGRLAVGIRTSAERLVWIDGVRPVDALYKDMRVHWSPLPKDAASVVINDGPAFPADARGAMKDMHATGDWVIADAYFGPSDAELHYELVALNTATGKVHQLPPKPGRIYVRAFILTQTEMVIGYKNADNKLQSIDELVRLELDKLPEIVTRWAAGKP